MKSNKPSESSRREPTGEQIPLLQAHYITCRQLVASGLFGTPAVIKAFEALPYSVLGALSWRPTHITPTALLSILDDWKGRFASTQRAHGVLGDRVDRHVRTLEILEGPEVPFDTWWATFVAHDATVLVTRREHSGGRRWEERELIALPGPDSGLFWTRGFTVRLTQKGEGAWLTGQRDLAGQMIESGQDPR